MKKFKNFWFYAGAFCLYLILTAMISAIAATFLSKPVYGFLLKNFATWNISSSNDSIIIVADDRTAEKYPNWSTIEER